MAISNLENILKYGLLSHNNPHRNIDISNQNVNALRTKRENIFNREIHDYVPFYFNPKNAMLYKVEKENKNKIIILALDKNIINMPNTIFSDGNASNNITNFYAGSENLSQIDWNTNKSTTWKDDKEVKRVMMAEVLVYEKVEISLIYKIIVPNSSVKNSVSEILKDRYIHISQDRNIFFDNYHRSSYNNFSSNHQSKNYFNDVIIPRNEIDELKRKEDKEIAYYKELGMEAPF